MPSLNPTAKDAKKKKSIMRKKVSKKDSPPPDLSTEFVQESDVEEDEHLDEASTSDEEDSLPNNIALVALTGDGKSAVPAADSSSASGSDSESAENSENEDAENEEPSETPRKASKELRSAKPASTAKKVSFEAPPYKPPTGFELATVDRPSSGSQLFESSALEGKQIWYITAPASVPISSIQEMSLANIQNGNVVLSHNDNDYGIVQDSSADVRYTKVMVAIGAEDEYRTASRSIDRILKVKEIFQLPSVYRAKETGNSARPQPSGLKMRFRPIGFGNGELGTIGSPSPSPAGGNDTKNASDKEMEDTPQNFRRPASLEQEESAASSTSSDDESSSSSDAEMADAPPSKSQLAVKPKLQKPATKESPQVVIQSLKRKHSEGGDMKAKNSSSNSATSSNRQLNPVKKKQKSSPAISQLVSTEAHRTVPSKLPHSTSQIPTPGPKQSHSFPTPSQNPASPTDFVQIRPPDSSQSSPHRNPQTSTTHSSSRQASQKPSRESPTKDRAPVVDLELSATERKKETKSLRKDKAKVNSKTEIKESATSSIGAANPSSQVHFPFEEVAKPPEKHTSRDGKKAKKEWKMNEMDEMENERVNNPVPSVSKSTPIPPPPKRSFSTTPPPKVSSKR